MKRLALLALFFLVPAMAIAMPPNEPHQLYALVLSPDGHTAATSGNDPNIRLFDVASGRPLRRIDAHQGAIWSLAFSPDGKTLASGGGDGTIKRWRVSNGAPLGRLARPGSKVMWLAYAPNGRQLVASWGWSLSLVNATTGRTRAVPRSDGLSRAVFSSDGRLLIGAGGGAGEGNVSVLDAPTLRTLHAMDMSWAVESVDVSRTGLIAAVSGAGVLHIWNARTGATVQRQQGEDANLYNVAFSPDGSQVVTCGNRATLVWDVATGKVVKQPKSGGAQALFLPDGNHLLLSSDDRSVTILDVTTDRAKTIDLP